MMTFGERHNLILAIMDWALGQDALTGFGVRTDGNMLVVSVEWGGRTARKAFGWGELDHLRLGAVSLITTSLERLMREADTEASSPP